MLPTPRKGPHVNVVTRRSFQGRHQIHTHPGVGPNVTTCHSHHSIRVVPNQSPDIYDKNS